MDETCANCDKAQLGPEQRTSVLLFEMVIVVIIVIVVIFVVFHYPLHMAFSHKLLKTHKLNLNFE